MAAIHDRPNSAGPTPGVCWKPAHGRHPAATAARSLFSTAADSDHVVFRNLLQQDEETQARDVLGLATDAEVDDMIQMHNSAKQVFLPVVLEDRVSSGPVFEGSQDLAADADIIIDDTLVEFKATRGSRPRADDTRCVRFERTDLYQLLGYLLLDYSDHYKIRNIMFSPFDTNTTPPGPSPNSSTPPPAAP